MTPKTTYTPEPANQPRLMTDEQLKAGMLFEGNRSEYAAELERRKATGVDNA